jgi:hypothetical protein
MDLAIGAQEAWRRQSSEARRDILERYALVEILVIPAGAEDDDIWRFPKSIGARVILDYACREEARRRGHNFDAPIELATEQALSLRDYRSDLEATLEAMENWPEFMEALQTAWAKTQPDFR